MSTPGGLATRPRALLFDVFGTLVDWRGSMIALATELGAEAGVKADWGAFVDGWRVAYPAAMDRVRCGDRAWANIDVLHGEAFDDLLVPFHLEALAPMRDRLVFGWHRLDAWPDVPAGLDRLRESATVASLSNGHLALQIDLSRHAGLRFDTLFSAENFGHYKPDPETYLGAAQLLGLEPGAVMLCAFHPSDLAAAARCGLRTALIRRPLEYGAGREGFLRPVHAGEPEFDLTVDGLDGLATALRQAAQPRDER